MIKRLSSIEFPPYKFIPGKAPHPEKEGGYLKGKSIEVEELNDRNYSKNTYYLYAIDLFNYGYYWESHVYWEALWNAAGRKGETADFLKGLIKIAAALVKRDLNSSAAFEGHLERAIELLTPINQFFGIDKKRILDQLQSKSVNEEYKLHFLE